MRTKAAFSFLLFRSIVILSERRIAQRNANGDEDNAEVAASGDETEKQQWEEESKREQ